MGGISVLVIERGPGVTTKKVSDLFASDERLSGSNHYQMDCTGIWSSGTAYITFEDVKVPVENLVGIENVVCTGHSQLLAPHL